MVERYADWGQWKKTIGQAVNIGEKVGLDENTIVKVGSKLGNFLDNFVEPENREQRVLKELWDVASAEEQKTLTRVLVKMVKAEEKLDH